MTRRIRRDRLAELFRSVHHSHSAARRADECAEGDSADRLGAPH